MYYDESYLSSREKKLAGAFAVGMHLLFLALLIFGVSWQKRSSPPANIVDLYPSLPTKQAVAPAQPVPQPAVKPEPKPEPRQVPKPAPVLKPEPKPVTKPEVQKPDLALKEKAEKERRLQEEKLKLAQKREEDTKAKQQQQAEAQRAKELQDEANRQAAAINKLKNEYIERIRSKIQRFVVLPPNLQGNPEAIFDVVLLPGGDVLNTRLRHSSGNAAYDSAVERAILKASPLPLPPDPAMFREFRELNLKFRPQE